MCGFKRCLLDKINSVPDRTSIIILIITNFICNNLFLFQLKYYADDWTNLVYPAPNYRTFSDSFLNPQRPISYAYIVLQQYIAINPLVFHLLAFITTTISLILIYFIFRRIFRDFGYADELYPFLAAMFFCVLFNKDQIYAWPIMSLGFGLIATILTIYLYLNNEKKYYLGLSYFIYFLSLLTYELGITVPALLFLYDYLLKKDWKKSLYFAVPLFLYLAIRVTSWFGVGGLGDEVDRAFGTYGWDTIITALQYPLVTFDVLLRAVIYSAAGYAQMEITLIGLLCIINIALLVIIYKYLGTLSISNNRNFKLIYVAIGTVLVFWAPYIVAGYQYLPTRAFYLCDIGIALLLVCGLLIIQRHINVRLAVIFIICLGLFVNQGLYYNWVVSGDIQEKIDNYLKGNADELIKYDYVYFNTRSFTNSMPQQIKWADISVYTKFKSIKEDIFESELLAPSYSLVTKQTEKQYDQGFRAYYNAMAIAAGPLCAMINEHTGYKKEFTVIYGVPGNVSVPLTVTKETITMKDYTGNISTVNRTDVFEINYTSVISFNRKLSRSPAAQ